MSSYRSRSFRPLFIGGATVCLAVLACALWLRNKQTSQAPSTQSTVSSLPVHVVTTPDLTEPAEDFSTFLYVLQTGGCVITRPVAIAWLDAFSRENSAMPEAHATRVMRMIAEGGHPSWEPGYRQHLYNSAFNALHHCPTGEEFTRQLLRLSLHDAERTLRLYAMQHLKAQRRIGHLPNGPLASEVHAALQNLAQSAEEDVSGYAIDVLALWNGGEESDPALQQLALATAADTSRSVDIRVTAIHAAGPASLPLARALSTRPDEHVMLRKAAIARIGEHGTVEDFPSLEILRQENSRLAQAAEPALLAIRDRLAHPHKSQPVPY